MLCAIRTGESYPFDTSILPYFFCYSKAFTRQKTELFGQGRTGDDAVIVRRSTIRQEEQELYRLTRNLPLGLRWILNVAVLR